MINIKIKTEYSFKHAYGHLQQIVNDCEESILGICDRNSTWGHVQFQKLMKKAGKKPIFGVELGVCNDSSVQDKEKTGMNYCSFIAKNSEGLREIYDLVTRSTQNFYYTPRIDYGDVRNVSENVIILSGIHFDFKQLISHIPNLFIELTSGGLKNNQVPEEYQGQIVATSNNNYPKVSDKQAYEVAIGQNAEKHTYAQHILDKWDLKECAEKNGWLTIDILKASDTSASLARECNVELPTAQMVKFKSDISLGALCISVAKNRGVDLSDPVYQERFDKELELIYKKDFSDYFFVIWDMLKYAKQHMLVGPARGSSCGSLICYILSITEIDPIPYGLIFERFIDINRSDMPDIDIDFPDNKRELIFEYCRNKYGADCVARLGTVSKFKARSTIAHVAKQLNIPPWEVSELKDNILERSAGDERAKKCIEDTFTTLDIGKKAIRKFPHLKIACELEGHSTHTGQHAAGIVITESPVNHYCSVDAKNDEITQLDKFDAEELNLLKIDALGLRTLSVIEDCLEQVNWSYEKIIKYQTDDKKAFAVLNDKKYAGIFQFEGYALQNLCNQMNIENFEDIAALTALARPGPLQSGGASDYLKKRIGKEKPNYLNNIMKKILSNTFGVIVYQEQVMHITRELGGLDWPDVSAVRKVMGKSQGREAFDAYWPKFLKGCLKNNVTEDEAKTVWENMNTMGAYSFNRSHAVSYALVSYWTCVLKSKFPLEWAAACLRHAKDDDQCIKLLRELQLEGYKYVDFDKEKSQINWSVQDGVLYGGLISVKGIGQVTAEKITEARASGKPLTQGMINKLESAKTPFKHAFRRESLFGDLIKNPLKYNITSRITNIEELTEESTGEFLIFGELKKKTQRNHNDAKGLAKRNGKKMSGQENFVMMTIEDDGGAISCMIPRDKYLGIGTKILEKTPVGNWILIKGKMNGGFRSIMVNRLRVIKEEEMKEDD